MRTLLALLAAIVLAACSKEAPEIVLVTKEPAKPAIAAECSEVDKSWLELRDDDIKRSEAARNYQENRDRYRVLLHKRRICRASLDAHFGEAPAKKE